MEQYSAESSRRTWGPLSVKSLLAALWPVVSSPLSLPELQLSLLCLSPLPLCTKWDNGGLTSSVSHLLGITVIHCLMSNVLRTMVPCVCVFVCLFSVVSDKKINLVPCYRLNLCVLPKFIY